MYQFIWAGNNADGMTAIRIIELIHELRDGPGHSVEICCPNDEGIGPDNERIECVAEWTDWERKAFMGDSLENALASAVRFKRSFYEN